MRKEFLPFSKPTIGQEEIDEVTDSLKSGWITTGPKVQKFECQFAGYAGCPYAVSVNSATSGLHIAYLAAGIKAGDEVITTPMTFISTVSMLVAIGAKPVLADIDPGTLNINPAEIEKKITKKTKAVVPVHFAGLPCDMDAIHSIAKKHNLAVIEDAAHAIGTKYKGKMIGSLSDATVFSFHPIKNITTGEGGMITTPHQKWHEELSLIRFHGMSKSAWKRYSKGGSPFYSIERLGFKYNMMDIQAAMGIHQLAKLPKFNEARTRLAAVYNERFSQVSEFRTQKPAPYDHLHSWHLYVIVLDGKKFSIDRNEFTERLQEANIGCGIHFTAVHQHPYYAPMFRDSADTLPNASDVSENILSLPLYPNMTEQDAADAADAVLELVKKYSKKTMVSAS